jgi:hypothetical protein
MFCFQYSLGARKNQRKSQLAHFAALALAKCGSIKGFARPDFACAPELRRKGDMSLR